MEILTENIPPQTAKFPAIIGERALIEVKLPIYKPQTHHNYQSSDDKSSSSCAIASQSIKFTYKSSL